MHLHPRGQFNNRAADYRHIEVQPPAAARQILSPRFADQVQCQRASVRPAAMFE